MKKHLALFLLATTLSAAAQVPADFSGHWLWHNSPHGTMPDLFRSSLKLVQQGDSVSGEWASGLKSRSDNTSEISGIHDKRQVRGQIRNSRLTLEYCSEGGQPLGRYTACPEYYQRFSSYYVLQSDGNLMEVKQPAFRPETFAIWHSYKKTTPSRPNFSGNWLSTNKPIWPTTKPFYEQLNLIQQGDTISGEWIRGRLSSLKQNSEISRTHAKGQVRGQIRNGRLTLEYCSEAGKFSPYTPCPQYQRFNSYYVMQSDGTLEKLILTGTHPYTYEFGYSFRKQ